MLGTWIIVPTWSTLPDSRVFEPCMRRAPGPDGWRSKFHRREAASLRAVWKRSRRTSGIACSGSLDEPTGVSFGDGRRRAVSGE